MGSSNKAELLSNNFLKTAENIVTHFDDKKKRDECLEMLKDSVGKICMHGDKMKHVTTTMSELKNAVDASDDPKEVLKLLGERKKELQNYKPDVSEHSIFVDYCQQVKEIVDNVDGTGKNSLGDDDIMMTQEEVNVIDAFSKKRMTDPVKNKKCGHVYDRDTVTSVLKMNKNTRCPVVGCSNKEYIFLENLVTDIKTRKFLHDNPA